jgi:hypothetical protein
LFAHGPIVAGPNGQTLDATIKRLTDENFKVRDTEKLRTESTSLRQQWLRALINQLDSHFPRVDILAAFTGLFDPTLIPAAGDVKVNSYGTEALHVLKEFYCPSKADRPPDGKLIERPDEKKAAKRARANFEARLAKGDLLQRGQLDAEWLLLRSKLVKYRDEFAAQLVRDQEAAFIAKARAAGAAARKKDVVGNASSKEAKGEPVAPADGKAGGKTKAKADGKAETDGKIESKSAEAKGRGQAGVSERPQQYRMAAAIKRFLTDESLVETFPNMAKLCSIALVLPASSVECERAFSFLNQSVMHVSDHMFARSDISAAFCRIKTVPRNRLKTDILNWLMMLSIHANSIKPFPIDAAVQYWASRWNHRVVLAGSAKAR